MGRYRDLYNLVTKQVKPSAQGYDPRFDAVGSGPRKGDRQRLQDLEFTTQGGAINKPDFSIVDAEGRPYISTMSDRTAADSTVTHIGGKELNEPINLQGGQDFMFDPENPGKVWASAEGPVGGIMKMANDLKAQTGKDPFFMPHTMSPSGGDFAHMIPELMIKVARQNMSKADIKELNKQIREVPKIVTVTKDGEKIKKEILFDNFVGIEHPNAVAQLGHVGGDIRKKLIADLDKFRDKGGISTPEARLIVSDPKQYGSRDAQLKNVGVVHAGKSPSKGKHKTYNLDVPGEPVGRIAEDITAFDLIPEGKKIRDFDKKKPKRDLIWRGIDGEPTRQQVRALSMNQRMQSGIIDADLLRQLDDKGLLNPKETQAVKQAMGQKGFTTLQALGANTALGATMMGAMSMLAPDKAEAGRAKDIYNLIENVGKINVKPELRKKQQAAFDTMRNTIGDVAEQQGYPRSLAKDVTMDENGVIHYPDDLIDALADAGKGDIGKMVADVNTETFDSVQGPDGVGLGTAYRNQWANEPGLGDPNIAKHGTGSPEIFTEFDVQEKVRPFFNDTPDSAVSDAFSGLADTKRQISKEKNMTPEELAGEVKKVTESSEARRIKPRTIPLQVAGENRWDFRNARHVDEVVDNLPDVDINNPDVIHGLNYEDLDDLRNGVIDAEGHVMVTDIYGDAVLKDRQDLKRQIKDGDWGMIENKEIGESAQQLGYNSGSVVEEMLSKQNEMTPSHFKTINRLTYDPRRAKLPWAFKDPAKFNSKDMMASVVSGTGTAGLGVAGAGYMPESEQPQAGGLSSLTKQEAARLLKTETPTILTEEKNAAQNNRDSFLAKREKRRGPIGQGTVLRPQYNNQSQGTWEGIKQAFTGENRVNNLNKAEREFYESAPEFGVNPLNDMGTGSAMDEVKLGAGLLTTWGDEGKKALISKYVPDVQWKTIGSEEGNNLMDVAVLPDGREMIVNKVGFSPTDGMNLAAELAAYSPFGRWSNAAKSIGGKMLRSGIVGGVTDESLQRVGMALGNEQEYDPSQTAIVASTGALGVPFEAGLGALKRGALNQKKQWKGLGDLEFPLE